MRLLLVEDEEGLRTRLAEALRRRGFAVDATGDGAEAVYLGHEYPVDVAILDLGLPGRSGAEVLEAWREAGRTFPVLILTARDRWQDKVAALEAGADDYLTKPFQLPEVIARVRALVRRAAGWARTELRAGDVAVDTARQSVTVDGRAVALTAYEYRLLEYLALHAGEVVSEPRLAEHLYEEDADRDSNVLEVLLARLRRKLDPEGTRAPVETLRGRGYRLRTAGAD